MKFSAIVAPISANVFLMLKSPDFKALENDNVIIEHHLAVGDVINEYHTNLDGCGYVVCTGESISDADVKAETIKNLIDKNIDRL